jgi:hypothetical protein
MNYQSLILAAGLSAGLSAAPVSTSLPVLPTEVPGSVLPVEHEHLYTMSGRVRMLLIWFGRDNVGSGMIRWRGAGNDAAYELLIGSDPLRAPARLNRWGYLAEEIRSGEAAMVGIMSTSNEASLDEVKTTAGTQDASRPFDTIRARVTPTTSFARVETVRARTGATYRDAREVLDLAFEGGASINRQVARPLGVRPGFLSAVAEMVHHTVGFNGRVIPKGSPVQYVYGDRLYELRLLEATNLDRFERRGRVFEHVVRSRFETARAGSRSGTRFELVYGSRGPLCEIPILISYQPKWWLQVELEIQ